MLVPTFEQEAQHPRAKTEHRLPHSFCPRLQAREQFGRDVGYLILDVGVDFRTRGPTSKTQRPTSPSPRSSTPSQEKVRIGELFSFLAKKAKSWHVLSLMSLRVLLISVAMIGGISAEENVLSEADREALLEKLKEVQAGAGGRAMERAGSALSAFRAAVGSDDKAHELYMKCVEKVRFQDEKLSAQQFREWRRKHKEKEDSDGFRRVLRHQLNWLLLTVEANAMEEGDEGELSTRAIAALDAIIGDEELEGDDFKILEEDVTKTVFALAYGISSDDKWPTSPAKLQEVYQHHILPPLAAKKNIPAFRSAWGKWVQQEANLQEAKSKSPGKGERSAAFDRFVVEKRPQMLWELEREVYGMGDQKGGALAMLKHLERFKGHKNEVQWTKEFLEILEPTEGVEALVDDSPTLGEEE